MEPLIEHLHLSLQALPPAARYLVAYSGGLDSQVLLHALTRLVPPLPLTAVHVHHGLSPNADLWSEFCAASCAARQVPYIELRVDARAAGGESREAAARAARYTALEQQVDEGTLLLTAHHQEDQAETLLLMLLRGAGAAGLAAMPACKPFGRGRLGRPLLQLPRSELRRYAEQHGLSWVDDESNFDTSYDRNFLRHQVLPLLRQRWPATERAFARSAGHMAEASELLQQLAQQDLPALAGSRAGTLSVTRLQALSPARRRNALRHWFGQLALPAPDSRHLARIETELLPAPDDAMPLVGWGGAEVRRYRDELYAMAPLAPAPLLTLAWDLQAPLALPAGLGTLQAERVYGAGVALRHCQDAAVTVSFRGGGERCQPAGRQHHHELKKLFQAAGVAPWLRQRTPLLLLDGHLAQVVGHWVCAPFAAAPDEEGVIIRWQAAAEIASGAENNDN